MDIAFIVIGVLGIIITSLVSERVDIVLLSFVFTMAFVAGLIAFGSKDSLKAIDVYRDKTELKITGEYKDSMFIPTDITVVFKKSD